MKDIKKKTLCLDCNSEVPEDSLFCPYCGSKNVKSSYFDKNNNSYKKCMNCDTIIPSDAIYCQFCGKKADIKQKNISTNPDSSIGNSQNSNASSFKKCTNCGALIPDNAIYCQHCGEKPEKKSNEADYPKNESINQQPCNQRNYFIPFVLATILCFLMGVSWYYSYSTLKNQRTDSRITQMVKYIDNTKTYDDFRSNRTILYKPTTEKVLIYANFGIPAKLYCEPSSEDVILLWDDEWDGNTIGLNITYTKSGVEYVRITNDANSKVFYIILVG